MLSDPAPAVNHGNAAANCAEGNAAAAQPAELAHDAERGVVAKPPANRAARKESCRVEHACEVPLAH